MNEKIGRNDPCPCGSGKKYKQCCIDKPLAPKPLKFKAKVLTSAPTTQQMPTGPNLMDRAFGDKVAQAQETPVPKPYKITKTPPSTP